jgi:hypothetical protein
MHQSSTLSLGADVHKESIVVADVAKEHPVDVVSLGTIGTGGRAPATRAEAARTSRASWYDETVDGS